MRLMPVLVLAIAAAAHASGPESYAFASTPFTPPEGFLWTPLLFLGIFTLANTLLLRWFWGKSWGAACGLALCIGLVVFLFTMFTSVHMHTQRVVYDPWQNDIFWGMDFWESSRAFLYENLLALLAMTGSALLLLAGTDEKGPSGKMVGYLLLVTLLVGIAVPVLLFDVLRGLFFAAAIVVGVMGITYAFLRFRRGALILIGVNVAVFLASLTPFVLAGAYQHGYLGDTPCRAYFVHGIGYMLIEYAQAHQGRLPSARTIDEMTTALHPYCVESELQGVSYLPDQSPTMCYAADSFDRHPHPYTWNPAASGKTITELRALNTRIILASCPYHREVYITSEDLVAVYDDQEKYISAHYGDPLPKP